VTNLLRRRAIDELEHVHREEAAKLEAKASIRAIIAVLVTYRVGAKLRPPPRGERRLPRAVR
jgi:hypothetical protein